VIICEKEANNPVKVLKTSALTLRKAWGELVIGFVGLQFGGLIVALVSAVWWVAAFALAAALKSFWILLPAVGLWLLAVFTLAYVSSVASQVYRCALYVYATTGQAPAPFTTAQMALAWKTKKDKRPKV